MYTAPQGSRLEYLAASSSYETSTEQPRYSMRSTPSFPEYSSLSSEQRQSSENLMMRTPSPAIYQRSGPVYVVPHIGRSYNQQKEYIHLPPLMAEYHFTPDAFLLPGKEGIFVGDAEEIRPFVEETFQTIFNQPFPRNIKISLLNADDFRKIAPHPGTIGLSLNRTKQGLLSEIFVLQGSLARVMLTLGHELGHVLTETLPDAHDEEAKAYAFSLAWMNTIRKHNIAHLENSFVTESPALNGLHNIAFAFIQQKLNAGHETWNLYLDLIHKREQVKGMFS